MIASAAKGGGTYTTVAVACVPATASATLRKIGTSMSYVGGRFGTPEGSVSPVNTSTWPALDGWTAPTI